MHNRGKAISFVSIDLEASFEEPLTTSFIYKCFLIHYVHTHRSERNDAVIDIAVIDIAAIFYPGRGMCLGFYQAIWWKLGNNRYSLTSMK